MKSSLLAAALCAGLATSIIAQSPTRAPSPAQPPANYDLQWGVKIPTRDGGELNATLYLPKNSDGSPPKTLVIFTLTPYISDTHHAGRLPRITSLCVRARGCSRPRSFTTTTPFGTREFDLPSNIRAALSTINSSAAYAGAPKQKKARTTQLVIFMPSV
jgi:hypothetical protein